MVKSFVEFRQDEEVMVLELGAYALTPAEHEAVRVELDAFEQKALAMLNYTFIDADSIRAELRGEHDAVKNAMRQLEASGWMWNE